MADAIGLGSLLKKTLSAGIVLVEDALEKWLDPRGDAVMRQALVTARDRAAELAIENARLHDDVERLTRFISQKAEDLDFSAGHLYSDEVALLRGVSQHSHVVDHDIRCRLLARFKNLTCTEEQLQGALHTAIHGPNDVPF